MNLDEALFKISHIIATVTQVDGEVVMVRRFELLDFSGEIAGALPKAACVLRALDLEGDAYRIEPTKTLGRAIDPYTDGARF